MHRILNISRNFLTINQPLYIHLLKISYHDTKSDYDFSQRSSKYQFCSRRYFCVVGLPSGCAVAAAERGSHRTKISGVERHCNIRKKKKEKKKEKKKKQ